MDIFIYSLVSAGFGFAWGYEVGFGRGKNAGRDEGYQFSKDKYSPLIQIGKEVNEQKEREEWGKIFLENFPTFEAWHIKYVEGVRAQISELDSFAEEALLNRANLEAEYVAQKSPRPLGVMNAAKYDLRK